jgi:glycosyltransferase involved in cell wall biosynthesis
MKIAFLHYHLKTGGVTTVLKRQISALQDNCEILVLTGDQAGTALPCRVVEIPGLGYDQPGVPLPAPDITAGRVLKALSDMWPGGCDVLHIHNPTLAKSQNLLPCIKRLRASGTTLFLQIHDFAEDGRPDAYSLESYPADCHYGVINTRDRRILVKAGLTATGVHLIPNVIHPLSAERGYFPKSLVLYPVRAIRRKNIGEAILLSLYLLPGHHLGVTLPPNSQRDMASYRDWRVYVKKKHLNVHFEIGRRHDYAGLVGTASSMVTTSITEGFGFSFLEPWTAGKLLRGRRLGDICTDFEKNGLCLDFLYDRLDVPLAWLDADQFFQAWQRTAIHAAATYHHPIDLKGIHQQLAYSAGRGVVDFGLLSERFQRQVLSHVLSNPKVKNHLKSLNPKLSFSPPEDDISEMLENNRRSVAAHYGVEKYGERLLSIYERVVHQPVLQCVDKQVLLDAFFDLNRFSLLKWGAYEG